VRFVNEVMWPGLVSGSLYALVALGINVVERVTKLVNFAHAQLILWAPLSVLLLTRQFHVPAAIAFFLATGFVVGLALAEERIAMRPFVGRSNAMPWVLSTLAIGLLLERAASYQFGGQPQSFPHNVGTRAVSWGELRIAPSEVAVVSTALTAVVAVGLLMTHTAVGKRLAAVADDPDGATSVGISAATASRVAAAIAAVVAAITGFIAAPTQQVGSALGLGLLFNGFVAAAIGGIGSLKGTLPGGLLLGLLLSWANANLGPRTLNSILFGALLVVYLIRPQGLFGTRALRSV